MADSTEETDGFPGMQVGTFIKGDHYVFRANTGEEFRDLIKSAAEIAADALDELAKFKQVVIAKGVFTGDSNGGSKAAPPRKSTGSKSDSAPPPDGVKFYEDGGEKWATGEGVDCDHGPRKDLRGKGYKADLYCSLDTKDFKKKCPPIKL